MCCYLRVATTRYVHQWVVNEHSRLSMGDRNELLDGSTNVVIEPSSSLLTTGVNNIEDPLLHRGRKTLHLRC